MDFSIEFYETASGRRVVEEELDALEDAIPALHALLLAGLSRLRQREYHRPPLCLPVGSALFELRVGRRDIARAIWFFQKGQRIVVVRVFVKKSQKTPRLERELALTRMS
ncbi:MAG: type II toxin-antitoxin system RelE/ParE family toxin, partial [Chloroflexi bacterium]|nr:type II toxin-antitoxin system RelE/ParE family toxin [Chloroflexota bacterium]